MADFKCMTLLSVRGPDANKYDEVREVRVIRWVVDGVPKSVGLAKTLTYKDKQSGEPRTKVETLNKEDLRAIQAKWKEIIAIVCNPPAYVPPATAPAAAQTDFGSNDGLEEVPF